MHPLPSPFQSFVPIELGLPGDQSPGTWSRQRGRSGPVGKCELRRIRSDQTSADRSAISDLTRASFDARR